MAMIPSSFGAHSSNLQYICWACRAQSRAKTSSSQSAIHGPGWTAQRVRARVTLKGAIAFTSRAYTGQARRAASSSGRTKAISSLHNAQFKNRLSLRNHIVSSSNASITTHSLSRPSTICHTHPRRYATQVLAEKSNSSADDGSHSNIVGKRAGIRSQLRDWQVQHADEEHKYRPIDFQPDADSGGPMNTFVRLPKSSALSAYGEQTADENVNDEAAAEFARSAVDDLDGNATASRFLQVGDLVELSFGKSGRQPCVAVFVQRFGDLGQFFDVNGKWAFQNEASIQYCIRGWANPSLVEPLIQYLPTIEHLQSYKELMDDAYLHDLSVPRSVSAAIVSHMQDFETESQEIYRRHANALDHAHDILAHETDLRYGSLVSAATTLLQKPAHELPVAALWATRSALTRGGVGFNFDLRSHRLTGYMQILSKSQVRSFELVRRWFRAWQDDMARVATMNHRKSNKYVTSEDAQIVYGFISKVKDIVGQSRQSREPTGSGCISPSKERYPLDSGAGCIRVRKEEQFSPQEIEILRFLEAWCCTVLFARDAQLESLPPLFLQKLGLYDSYGYDRRSGFMLLQEIGTFMPFDNRIRFDPHLLLPSSQHSKPLEVLVSTVYQMEHNANFDDSLAHIRHDWGDMPVYCIDSSTAQEIDDGISVQKAGVDADGKEQYWVHVHIANPTAFFNRDHPLAKMARHMGETIYTPERVYTMMPPWVARSQFSLARQRPCLTFSVKMDLEGRTLEQKIVPGTVHNVFQLTPDEVNDILGVQEKTTANDIVLTVGGDAPPPTERKGRADDITPEHVDQLKTLYFLAEKRSELRKKAGGLFFNTSPLDIEVWNTSRFSGLPWYNPWRFGRRAVKGDPVIQMKTKGLLNWFTASFSASDVTVREMMLLACETAARWCAERQIPFIYRGSVLRPSTPDANKYLHEVLEPAAKNSPNGEWPLHLAREYIAALGTTILSTTPLKHRVLGQDYYGKVTSPLRRYADMIAHWQIEAALLEEARTGQSLVTDDKNVDRSFLPFNKPSLENIFLGLQPREWLISQAKARAVDHWTAMVLFRAIHYGEAEVPLPKASALPAGRESTAFQRYGQNTHSLPLDRRYITRLYLYAPPKNELEHTLGLSMELNVKMSMAKPESLGLEPAMVGDIWETQIERVDVFSRQAVTRPVRLIERNAVIPS